ncbi:hypothetical protein [Fibrobacter sp. UWB13]|uniref:hypothetical protein n=1 Tax=Fibrobacter sp. UWB13 TaxID=1896204 RepID=UPI000A0A5480|nr:hypothetical protein [Fibrobacter sp. UWB13]SMG09731.1 hypothetical protein SAMN05720489_0253 [Fibrobacter sp. UWB13]
MKIILNHWIRSFLAIALAIFLASCSSITRPPPAAAFMDSYGRNDVINNVSFSYYAGQLKNGVRDEDGHNTEWWGDASFERFISGDYFTFGYGLQSLTPIVQAGFASPYFGITGWGNAFAILYAPMHDSSTFFTRYSGGGMLIEQIPINDKWKLGFTQHLSRNGREIDNGGRFRQIWIPNPEPKFYTEVGGGLFITGAVGENCKMSFELRYGRDLDEKRNRFAITIDFWGFSSPFSFGGNDEIRKAAAKNLEKMKNIETASIDSARTDTLHTIKRRWFRFSDSSQTISTIYHPVKNVTASTTKGICYNEKNNTVWLKQDYGKMLYQVSADSIDYCQEMERKNLLGTTLLEGLLGFLIAAQTTGNFPAAIAIGASFGTGIWALFNFGFDPEELAPKVYPELCSEKHPKEQIIEWLKQYPCGGDLQQTAP